jgi:hypothetical protein
MNLTADSPGGGKVKKEVFLSKNIRKGYPARPSWTILVSVWHACACLRFFWLKE